MLVQELRTKVTAYQGYLVVCGTTSLLLMQYHISALNHCKTTSTGDTSSFYNYVISDYKSFDHYF